MKDTAPRFKKPPRGEFFDEEKTKVIAQPVEATPMICAVCDIVKKREFSTIYHEDQDCVIFACPKRANIVIGVWKRHGETEQAHIDRLRQNTIGAAASNTKRAIRNAEVSQDGHLLCEVTLGR